MHWRLGGARWVSALPTQPGNRFASFVRAGKIKAITELIWPCMRFS